MCPWGSGVSEIRIYVRLWIVHIPEKQTQEKLWCESEVCHKLITLVRALRKALTVFLGFARIYMWIP